MLWALVYLARVGRTAAVAAANSAVAQRNSCPSRRCASSQAEQPVRARFALLRAPCNVPRSRPMALSAALAHMHPGTSWYRRRRRDNARSGASASWTTRKSQRSRRRWKRRSGSASRPLRRRRRRPVRPLELPCCRLCCGASDLVQYAFHLPWLGGRDQAVAVGAVQARAAPLLDRQQASLRRDAHLATPHQPAAARPGAEPPRAEAGAWQCRIGEDCT